VVFISRVKREENSSSGEIEPVSEVRWSNLYQVVVKTGRKLY